MKLIVWKLIGIIIISLVSCAEDDSSVNLTPILDQIINQDGSEDYFQYTYIEDGRPARIIDSGTFTYITVYTYVGEKASEVAIYRNDNRDDLILDSESKLLVSNEIIYDKNNRIDTIINTDFFFDEPKELLYTYHYDNGELIRLERYDLNISENKIYSELYSWENGNMSRLQYYDGDDCLLSEEFYVYDDNPNFYQKDFYIYPSAQFHSVNNIISFESYDNCWFIDYFCKPCENSYIYNNKNYPVSKISYNEQEFIIRYK